eukprot:CAMPEP_0197706208 /NCGR_PEP_ID=MMETSP1338-20131121/126829_1 /TAXON_ID=43686 ORGANISM="Pelagodinium beii, Strain RCC1491" /NCGR_SAMPLE_ID=MMETSP1338 /ASSEMBLY_ACC=CAM_ASM_000754 /LENGTH=64 /DNA_ID=CAMNT_0043290117 /DNA_START=465 /DNA_END=659 /DNA_ORIENTATION=+
MSAALDCCSKPLAQSCSNSTKTPDTFSRSLQVDTSQQEFRFEAPESSCPTAQMELLHCSKSSNH